MKPGRSKNSILHINRNRTLAARYYYWTELQRRRFDDVISFLKMNEFFIGEQSINDVLTDQGDYIGDLIKNKVSHTKLRKEYPGFDWEKNAKI